ncbi:putative exonuclease SbcCD C subunit [Actinokineospora spheciospongiae]|nr:putative exonuclease SbcCD C subunit [Actinokineospora spheciospongiae]
MTALITGAETTGSAARQGLPAVEGRWQPTRAGVLNSWKWTDERFHFANGWLAFIGSNGSGKSLTASGLVTVLLDGDTSQAALNVSGSAAGTLLSRHTDNREKEDKTGVWWLEYGRTDPDTATTEYVTTGLWLRSSGPTLLRAFFLVSGRVGHEIELQQDRNPVGIERISEQLAAHGGELFTDAARLRTKAGAVLRTVSPQGAYRAAVRLRLFAPLDEVQYDALLSVLRTLRSVRTAEKISAKDMLSVLTDALPALDQVKLAEIATAMQRIATQEARLVATRDQARKLTRTDRAYDRYRQAVALATAASLRSANTEFDNLTRSETAAENDLARATARADDGREALIQRKQERSQWEGKAGAAETLLRKHAGAELPFREQRARELDEAAEAAERRARTAIDQARAGGAKAAETARVAAEAQQSASGIAHELATTGRPLGAAGALENMLAATAGLTLPEALLPDAPDVELAVDELAVVPLVWVEAREEAVENVVTALGKVGTANQSAVDAGERLRLSQDIAAQRADQLTRHTADRAKAEQHLTATIAEWHRGCDHYPPVPDDLLAPDLVDNRVDPAGLAHWLAQQTDRIRQDIDVPGHRGSKQSADRAAEQAVVFAQQQKDKADTAADAVTGARRTLDDQVREADDEADRDAAALADAEAAHGRRVEAALSKRHDHFLALLDDTGAALEALRHWEREAERWRTGLRHLNGSALTIPISAATRLSRELRDARRSVAQPELEQSSPAVRVAGSALEMLAGHDDTALRSAVASAAQQTARRLHGKVVDADNVVRRLGQESAAVEADLAEARKAPSPPPAPAWRTRSDGHPLWSLVDFHDDVPTELRDYCEGALLAAGILDAVVTADGRARVGDTVLATDRPAADRSLAEVLFPERDAAIEPGRIQALLRAVDLVDVEAGVEVRSGVITAVAPPGHTSRFIGTTARERARAARVVELQTQLAVLEGALETATSVLRRCQDDETEAAEEQATLPGSALWQPAHATARATNGAAQRADRDATTEQQRAGAELDSAREAASTALRLRERKLSAAHTAFDKVVAAAENAANAAQVASDKAEEVRATAAEAAAALRNTVEEQAGADEERQRFPSSQALTEARAAEDDAERRSTDAQAQVVEATERSRLAKDRSRQEITALNRLADLGGGRMLPTGHPEIKKFRDDLQRLSHMVRSWQRVAERTLRLCEQARVATAASLERAEHAETERASAAEARATAVSEAAAVADLRRMHGADYELLRENHDKARRALEAAVKAVEDTTNDIHGAELAEERARATLDGIAPRRADAEQERGRCLDRVHLLVEESFAKVGDGVPVDDSGRPANLTAALTWSTRLLDDQPRGQSREDLARAVEAHRSRLEAEAKRVSAELTRYDRQVTLQTIPRTDWRRAVVAAPEALVGEDLHTTVTTLEQTAEQLESDLRDDVKITLKTSMFTALRRDIATRRAAAQELVRQISSTLEGVRTGVARVGVKVEWAVRDDPDAKRMVGLINAIPSDDTFQQMYDVLRQRLEDATGDTWEARVAHTFDYRMWHEWRIDVTHASFSDGTTEVFRRLKPRSNPLAMFSTGEMRLATMLPLLAAAWSTYEAPGYQGPRLLFVDEVNAAFDPQNVRKLLALLREWEFDVLATAPEMSAMLKAEAEQVMIAQVTQMGRMRVSVPWLWSGSGQPVLVEGTA